MNTGCF